MDVNTASIEVAAGLAVQGQYSGIADNIAALIAHGNPFSPELGFGLAQAGRDELNALGLGDADPTNPTVAVKVMENRINNAQDACFECGPVDKLIAAALGQNNSLVGYLHIVVNWMVYIVKGLRI